MAEQSDNEFRELPQSVQVRIGRESTEKFNKVIKSLENESIPNVLLALREVYMNLLRSSAVKEWKYIEKALKDQDELVNSYDLEIKELNEVIQRKAVNKLNQ